MSAAGPPITLAARGKLNLYLHVTGRRADGLHHLDSLVAFAELADTLTVRPAKGLSLAVDGPFAAALGPAALIRALSCDWRNCCHHPWACS